MQLGVFKRHGSGYRSRYKGVSRFHGCGTTRMASSPEYRCQSSDNPVYRKSQTNGFLSIESHVDNPDYEAMIAIAPNKCQVNWYKVRTSRAIILVSDFRDGSSSLPRFFPRESGMLSPWSRVLQNYRPRRRSITGGQSFATGQKYFARRLLNETSREICG